MVIWSPKKNKHKTIKKKVENQINNKRITLTLVDASMFLLFLSFFFRSFDFQNETGKKHQNDE